jgi:hypothetical protein
VDLKHVWPTITAAIASLKNPTTGLPAKITEFNAEGGHGVTLTAPVDVAYYPGGNDLIGVDGFPAVEVYISTGEIGRSDAGENGFAVNRVEANVDDDPVVVLWMEGEKGEIPELYEQIVGLGMCALSVLLPTGAFGPGVEVTSARYAYSIVPDDPTAENREFQKWRTACVLTFHTQDVTPIP